LQEAADILAKAKVHLSMVIFSP